MSYRKSLTYLTLVFTHVASQWTEYYNRYRHELYQDGIAKFSQIDRHRRCKKTDPISEIQDPCHQTRSYLDYGAYVYLLKPIIMSPIGHGRPFVNMSIIAP